MSESITPGQKLHHVGFVVASISQAAERFAALTGGSWDGRIFHDPIQTVRVTFIRPGSPLDPLIELVEPVGEDSRVSSFLKRGGGLHHLCYEVEELEAHLAHDRSLGGLIVQPPAPAVAYDGRRIAWVYTPDRLLLEYLESRKDGERGTQGRD
jgi:methylmalonyl-CoA/ethylmalonyl-CoA epimerase